MKKLLSLFSVFLFIEVETIVAQYTVLYNFNGTTGASPRGDLTLLGRKLYGITDEGGVNGNGVIFKLIPREPGKLISERKLIKSN